MEKNENKNNHNFKIVILIAIFTIICFSSLNISYGANITVTNTNTSVEIQNAINSNMNSGDVLTFTEGNYNNITLNVNKAITLNGSGSTINGSGTTTNNNYNAFNITASNVKIQNFKIQNYDVGISVTTTNTIIKNNTITNNEYGILLYSSSNNLINNTANNNDYGIYLTGSSINNFTGNSICDNSVAIYLKGTVRDNVFSYNRIAGNTELLNIISAILSNNTANFNWWGNNTPTGIMNISGFEVSNWFIIKLNSTVSSANIGENVGYSYYFILNDGSIVDTSLFPDFNGIITINGAYSSFLGKKSFNDTAIVEFTGLNIIANLDQETIHLTITGKSVQESTPVPSKSTSSLGLFLDRHYGYGYLVGQATTVTWVTNGIANLNQRAMIQFIENGKVWHTQYVLLSDGNYQHKFIMPHKTLDVVMTFLEDNDSYGSSDKVPTYVDSVNDRRTFVEIKNMSNLTVGKKGNINIIVKDYKGNIIQTGKIILKFDNKWSFTVVNKDGVAKFSKIFTKAGNNRTLKITYIKENNNTNSTLTTKIVVKKK